MSEQNDQQQPAERIPLLVHSSNDAAVIASRRLRMGVIGVLVTSMVVLSALQVTSCRSSATGGLHGATRRRQRPALG